MKSIARAHRRSNIETLLREENIAAVGRNPLRPGIQPYIHGQVRSKKICFTYVIMNNV